MDTKIGNFIRDKRNEKGISQLKAAYMVGVSPNQFSRYELSKSIPSIAILARMADALGFTGNELFEAMGEKCRPIVSFDELQEEKAE